MAAAALLWSTTALGGFSVQLQATPADYVLAAQRLSLDVMFTDLDALIPDIITAYTLAVVYPENLLQPTALSYGSSDLMSLFFTDTNDSVNNPFDYIDAAFGQGVASDRIAFSELSFDSDADIALLQQGIDSFHAVTIDFVAIGEGVPRFSLIYDIGQGLDVKGANNQPYANMAVPIPGSAWLLGLALPSALLARRRRQCASSTANGDRS